MIESNIAFERSPQPLTQSSHRLVASRPVADLIGTIIALLTLILPTLIILHFSSPAEALPHSSRTEHPKER